jgi:hypothetical protein
MRENHRPVIAWAPRLRQGIIRRLYQLEALSHGPGSPPGLQETWEAWRCTLNQTAELWHDERLRWK